MSGAIEVGGAATPPKARPDATGQIGRYHGPGDPHKRHAFNCAGRHITLRGCYAAFMQAMLAAGEAGVTRNDCVPWLANPSDAYATLRDKHHVRIDSRKGKPHRWILRSDVQEVQP